LEEVGRDLFEGYIQAFIYLDMLSRNPQSEWTLFKPAVFRVEVGLDGKSLEVTHITCKARKKGRKY
jgi:hypothetical protein